MRSILEEIRSGAFAREWAAEAAKGPVRLAGEIERAQQHPIEEARRRALGPDAPAGEPGKSRNTLSKD
jgi:ketol-acid reductoisomerase